MSGLTVRAQEFANKSVKIHTDFIVLDQSSKPVENIFYESDTSFTALLNVKCFKYTGATDSMLVFSKIKEKQAFKNGLNKVRLDYSANNPETFILSKFYEVLKNTEITPPGDYKIFISLTGDFRNFSRIFLLSIDSTLAANSSLRKSFNTTLSPVKKTFLGFELNNVVKPDQMMTNATQVFDRASGKMAKACKKRGVTSVAFHKNNKKGFYLYYQDWFLGKYEINEDQNINKQLSAQQAPSINNPLFHGSNDLHTDQSVFAQVKNSDSKAKKEDKETMGEIGISTNLSTGQELYSQTDNNYVEVRGQVETEVVGMPVILEGMYTTQDKGKQAKASYVRMHYDADKAKDNLSETTNSYNKEFSETMAKSQGTRQIYQDYIGSLENKHSALQADLIRQMNVAGPGADMGSPDVKQKLDSAFKGKKTDTALSDGNASTMQHSSTKGQALKDSALEEQKKLQEKYDRLNKMQAQIDKYKFILNQNKNTAHFDSILAYNKTKDLGNTQDMSYKQMAQKANNILPDGKAKNFLSGLTSFDVGVFPKYASQYTMSGQTMKGLDLGYDLGIFEAGMTLGRTEYIDREGNLDKYNCYSARLVYKQLKHQKIGFIYYGYSPSQQLLSDNFFKNSDLAYPSFKKPVHIFSLNYEGDVSKYVKIVAEGATSYQKTEQNDATLTTLSGNDRAAYKFSCSAAIPKTSIHLEGEFDRTGLNFQNNTLPVTMNGTELYKFSYMQDFLKSFVSIGVDYDRLLQSNFSTTGSNTKYGFNIKTNSRRYPSVSVSYKPYATFRSNTDTLSIPQHPLIGSVWTSKASYQFKKNGRVLRFSCIYNISKSTTDTTSYSNKLLQFNTIYTKGKLMANFSAGNMQLSGNIQTAGTPHPPNNTNFVTIGSSYALTRELSLSASQDIAVANFGFCRYSLNGGIVYQFKKLPLATRANLRFNTYQSDAYAVWSTLYSGNFDVVWQIRKKTLVKGR
jgi:hypothetical protein